MLFTYGINACCETCEHGDPSDEPDEIFCRGYYVWHEAVDWCEHWEEKKE